MPFTLYMSVYHLGDDTQYTGTCQTIPYNLEAGRNHELMNLNMDAAILPADLTSHAMVNHGYASRDNANVNAESNSCIH